MDKKIELFNTFYVITPAEITNALSAVRPSAVGPDKVNLQKLKSTLAFKLSLLFNAVLLWGKMSSRFFENRTILLHKGGDTARVDNWRPITISPLILRLLNRILNNRLQEIQLNSCQRGFCKIDGTLLNNITLHGIIKKYRSNKKPFSVVSLDLKRLSIQCLIN